MWLAYWWCINQPDTEQQALFTRLLRSLSFARMGSDFVGSVVARCPLVIESKLLPSIMTHALSSRGKIKEGRVPETRIKTDMRGYRVDLYAALSKAQINALAPGVWDRTPLELVHGYPLVLRLCKTNTCYRILLDSPFREWRSDVENDSNGKMWDGAWRMGDEFCFRIETARLRYEHRGPFNEFYLGNSIVFDREDEDEADEEAEGMFYFNAAIDVDYDVGSLR